MGGATSVSVSCAVEGDVDEAVVRRVLESLGATAGIVYGKSGKAQLRQRIRGYNNAAQHALWLVLVDLDHDAECAPLLRQLWLPDAAPWMCFRVAVRAVEAWLLADRERIASFLDLPIARVPEDPEALDDPKRTMVDLARSSRRRDIREDMIPRRGSGRAVGPAYTSRLIEFVSSRPRGWRPDVASLRCDSLRRTTERLRCLMGVLGR